MKRIKRIIHRVAALFLTLIVTLGCISPAFNFKAHAEAIEVMNGSCTIADIIMSYCASGGVAIMNNTVIDDVYNTYGSSFGTISTFVRDGLLSYVDGTYVDTGLSTSIQSSLSSVSSLDIGSLFNQTAQQNPAGVALTGAASLGGVAGSVASIGILPVTAGVAISGYCGFQIGTIIANMLGLYDKAMGLGVDIDTSENILNNFALGQSIAKGHIVNSNNEMDEYICGSGVSFGYYDGDNIYFGIYNNGSNNMSVHHYKYIVGNSSPAYSRGSNVTPRNYFFSFISRGNGTVTANNMFSSYDEFVSALNKWRNETEVPKGNVSPDVIGPNGNVRGNIEDGKYVFPNVSPQVNPETQSIDPSKITEQDWKDYANSVQQNNNTTPDNNSSIFDDIMSQIRIDVPSINPDPDPDPDPDPVPNPVPETVPVPNVNPYPDTYPVADPETVPDNKPQPEYTEKATENETDIIEGDPYTTPDLLNKFPFCIPRDILKVFKKLDSGARQAPHIQWHFNPNNMIDYTFDIDFSTWDSVAALLRLLELAAFIIALGIATRNLILS